MTIQIPTPLEHLIVEDEPLWPLTSIHVGGVARWLAVPHSVDEVRAVFSWIQSQGLSHVVLGGGTNVIFPDAGFPGVVVWMQQLKGMAIDDTAVTVSSGEPLSHLAMKLNRLGLSGLEWACGIPGTVGGALAMNAGTRDGEMAGVVVGARVLTPSGVDHWSVERLKFGYRTSGLRTPPGQGIALEVDLKLHSDDPMQCIERERSMLDVRQRTQPQGASCGCIFKNPETGSPAGMLLDQAGCKGMRVGAAVVSDVHANFIINEGQDNASDVLALIQQMRSRVIEARSISLKPEVVIVE